MDIEDLLAQAILIISLLLPFVLVAWNIVLVVKKKENPIFEIIAFFFGAVYMLGAIMLWGLPDYDMPLNVYGTEHAHMPFNGEYLGAILLFGAWGFVSYLVLKYWKKKMAPLVEVFLLAGVYVGFVLNGIWMIQLLCGANPQSVDKSVVFGEGHEGIVNIVLGPFDYLIILCLCVVPVIYLIHLIRLIARIVKDKAVTQEKLVYENRVLDRINRFLCKGVHTFWLAFVALLPLLGVLVGILVLFGQQPDSVILAFTKTSDWILSGEISPPPVAYDTHYLCTVSLRGHRKLVKPTRFGIRRGEKIVVNRQLCVANAFEQLIQERAPKFHRAVRNFYDTYGYPISKHINSAWTADVVYLIMKPLEWIFLFVLYLCDVRPEDRICSQYLPKNVENMRG